MDELKEASDLARASSSDGFFSAPWIRALSALLFVFLLGLIFNADGAFFQWGTHRDMLRQISVIGILACGMTLVIITAGIDLSVGSVLGLNAVLFALLSLRLGWASLLAVGACLMAGVSSLSLLRCEH
jgi:ribose/xylose/arabinose/galactoside ABC-type transport system permease subunit